MDDHSASRRRGPSERFEDVYGRGSWSLASSEDIEREYVELTMPKFEFESEFSLKRNPQGDGDAQCLRP